MPKIEFAELVIKQRFTSCRSEVLFKKTALKTSQNSLENTCAGVFLIKLQVLGKQASGDIFKKTFFQEYVRWLLLMMNITKPNYCLSHADWKTNNGYFYFFIPLKRASFPLRVVPSHPAHPLSHVTVIIP